MGLVKRSCRELLCRGLRGPGIPGDLRDLLYISHRGPPVRRPRRSRDIRRSCIEVCHMGVLCRDLAESSCEEISRRGLVKRSCRELLYRDLS